VKTNAARQLEGLGIDFEIRTYDVDLQDLSATTVARKVGLLPEQVWKTLVARGDRTGVLFALVAADQELDPKALAAASGNRRVELVPLAEVEPLTGYVRGGVTALGGRKAFPVHVDETIVLFDAIAVSAGTRGAQIILSPDDFVRATSARLAPISRLRTS
jgi:Cys-tRNA(Pro)/Cys-tRNA(Cys) deacylase